MDPPHKLQTFYTQVWITSCAVNSLGTKYGKGSQSCKWRSASMGRIQIPPGRLQARFSVLYTPQPSCLARVLMKGVNLANIFSKT